MVQYYVYVYPCIVIDLTYLPLFIRDYYYAMFADGGFLTLHSYKVCMKGLMEKITKLPLD
jgi:hypothetical protein